MNEAINTAAKHALTAPHYVTLPHCCQMWVREVLEHVYKLKYDDYMKPTAALSALAFKNSPFAVPLKNGSAVGDILYRIHGSGGDGHVGIRIDGNRVAENSSVHWGDDEDARGIRTLKEFGNFDLIVRLPSPKSLRPRT
jgi:hypothetical protein